MKRKLDFSFTAQEVYELLLSHLYEIEHLPWPPEKIGNFGEDKPVRGMFCVNENNIEDTDELISITIEEK